MHPVTYRILQLISGEHILCALSEDNGKYEITRPLLMHVSPQLTVTGMTESLMLSRWVQPFTDAKYFEIDPKHVIIMLPASPGLSIYYEGVLDKLEGPEEMSTLHDSDEEEIYEEL